MTAGTSPGYAAQRTVRHLLDYHHLADGLESGVEPERLPDIMWRDKIF